MRSTFLSLGLLTGMTVSAQSIVGYRWWINDDPATLATATSAPTPELVVASALAMPLLNADLHRITLQALDDQGYHSVPYTTWFTRSTGPVTGYEWWIDDAIADRTAGSLGPNTVVDLIADLPTGLPAGNYTFTIRFSGASGTWSVPLSSAFDCFVGIAELPGVSELLLFPNPVTDQLGLRIKADEARSLSLQVLDLTGAVVLDLSSWAVCGNATRQWDIGVLAAGSYLLRMRPVRSPCRCSTSPAPWCSTSAPGPCAGTPPGNGTSACWPPAATCCASPVWKAPGAPAS